MNERLTLQDLVDILAQKQDMTKKDAEVFLRELIAVISETIEQNDPVKIKDFGTFKLVKVNARKSVDVNTGEAIEIPAHYKLSFVPDKSLKEAVNHPFAHFESVVLEEGLSFENVETVETNDEGEEVEEADDYKEDEIISESIAVKTEIETTLEDSYSATIDAKKELKIVEEISPVDDESDVIAEDVVSPEDIVSSTVQSDEATNIIESPQPEVIEQSSVTEGVVEELENNLIREEEKNQEEVIESEETVVVDETSTQNEKYTPSETTETESEKMFESHKRKTIRRRFISLAFILLLIVGAFALGGLYFQEIMNCFSDNMQRDRIDKTTATIKQEKVEKTPKVAVPDTTAIATNKMDSTAAAIPEKQEEVEVKPAVIIKDTIKSGSTLRMMSLKHFGHKSFWPYIYEENKDIIKNPNNVPLGTELIIPSVEKYGIDAKDQESIKKAKEMESKLIREFNL
ncbi:HU family DNA-binding protein [Dysgonomonas sp. Marseille-P4361]|uniref:HU family DNA-binding protein n=1 Tax=Dysgonomonas sp. Marseille-P4361 TaxID=2161820 RepID=UPI000D54EC44|nr:HU family DNA-binding protein [Dysgonomonas sp. Marseille-P4361]